MDSEIFEKLPPTKLFFRLAIPSMITMAFGALYQIADGLFVGRFIGEDALAAVNLIMPIIMIVFGFANLIATGASVRKRSISYLTSFSSFSSVKVYGRRHSQAVLLWHSARLLR